MKIKQTIITGLILSALSVTFILPVAPKAHAAKCGDVDTAIIGGPICSGVNNKSANAQDSAVWKLLIFALNILTAGVGVAAVGGIVYAAILYTSAGDSAEQTKKAKTIIRDVIIGIIAFGLMYSVLNFLIPGGIFT